MWSYHSLTSHHKKIRTHTPTNTQVQHECKTHMRLLGKQKCLQAREVSLPDGVCDKGSTKSERYVTSHMDLFGGERHESVFVWYHSDSRSVLSTLYSWGKISRPSSQRVCCGEFMVRCCSHGIHVHTEETFSSKGFHACLSYGLVSSMDGCCHRTSRHEHNRTRSCCVGKQLTIAPRNLVAGDGPFAAFGTWIKQFYSEKSVSWGDLSLEWLIFSFIFFIFI